MKKSIRLSIIFLLSFIFTLCVSALSITAYANTDGDNVGGYGELFGKIDVSSFSISDKASIRGDYPTGIRFELGISKTQKSSLASKNAKYGALITLNSLLGENEELTFESSRYLNIEANNWLKTRPSQFGADYEGYLATLVGGRGDNLENFGKDKYNEIFVARGYVKYTVDGEEVIVYTKNSVARSIAGVAEFAIDNGYEDDDFANQIVQDAKEQKQLTLTFAQTDGTQLATKTFVVGHILSEKDLSSVFIPEEYKFLGWYEDENFTKPFEFDGILTQSKTVYAKVEQELYKFSASTLSKSDGSSTEYAYSQSTMSGSDAKPNTYLYSSIDSLSDTSTIKIDMTNAQFDAGKYMSIDFYVKTRKASDKTGLYENRLFENVNNTLNVYAIYDSNDNLIPDRMVSTGSWYKAVIKIENTSIDNLLRIGGESAVELYIAGISVYTPEYFTSSVAKQAVKNQISETEYSLISNGESQYKIVLPDTPEEYETKAAEELIKYVQISTGIALTTVNESAVSFNENSKLIVVGETEIASENGVVANYNEYGDRGFKIKQVGSNVIIVGGSDMGTLCGAYEFLSLEFGFEAYAIGYSAIEQNVFDKKLLALDISDIPDMEYTHGYYHKAYREDALAMRFNYYDDIFLPVSGQPWHNTFSYVSPDDYASSNPEWFYSEGGAVRQLNYTQIGENGELSTLQQKVLDKIIARVEADFNSGNYYKYVGFTHEDNSYFPTDSSLTTTYGDAAPAAMLIKFINPIAQKLKEYVNTKYGDRELNIVISAYLKTEYAPVELVGSSYQPIDDSVVLSDNVLVLLAPIKVDYAKEFIVNNELETLIKKWNAITTKDDNMLWIYDSYQYNNIMYFDNTYNIKNIMELANGAAFMFNETCQPTAFNPYGELKTYLTSKLSWDSTLDIHELVDNFFDGYYGVASENMFKAFDRLLSYIAPMLADKKPAGGTETDYFQTMSGADYYWQKSRWTKEILTEITGLLDRAYADIEYLETTDNALYEELWGRITRVSFMTRYLLLEHYPTETYSSTEFDNEKQRFIDDCNKLGIEKYSNKSAQNIQTLMDNLTYA